MAQTPKPLLYRPPPRWQWWAAFGGAVAIHLTAVALAQKHEPPPVDLPDMPTAVIEATLQPEEQPTPPPEDIPLPEPAPRAAIKAPQAAGHPGPMSMSSAKALATYAPRPQYPYEARSRHVTGSGVCVVTVDTASGSVNEASMAQSIGNPILDNAATSAFRQWRFKPGTVSKVRIPITFTMTGASY